SLLAIPSVLLHAYKLLAWMRAVPGLYGAVLVTLLFQLGITLIQGFVGLHVIARRLWAIWAGLLLRLLVLAAYVLGVWWQVRSPGALEERGNIDLTAQYSSMLELGLVNSVPFLACLVALYAYYCNRGTWQAPKPSTASKVGAILALSLFGIVAFRYVE